MVSGNLLFNNNNNSNEEEISENSFPISTKDIIIKYNRKDEILKNNLYKNKAGCNVYLRDISYFEIIKNEKIELLKGLDLYLKPKEMTLVIGDNSCKYLFNILRGKYIDKFLSGRMLFNGNTICKDIHHRNVSYLQPEDAHMPLLTIKETLRFALDCQYNDSEISSGLKDEIIENELIIAGLYNIKDVLVDKIDILEKRKLTILTSLIKGPGLILGYDITNGLDPEDSLELIKLIGNNIDYGYSSGIVFLQQPSVEISSLFTKLIIMLNGEIYYYGSMSDSLKYFKENGFHCPPHLNPTDYFLSVLEDPAKYTVIEPSLSFNQFKNAYKESSDQDLSFFQIAYTKFCSIYASTVEISFIIFNGSIPILMLLSGFAQPNVRGWWNWLHILSPFTYVFRGLSVNNFIGQTYYCEPFEYVPPLNDPLLNATYPIGYEGNQVCPKTTGKEFIEVSNITQNNGFQWICVSIVLGYALFFYTVSYIGLKFIKFGTKRPKPKEKEKEKKKYKNQTIIDIKGFKNYNTGSYLVFKNIYYYKEKKNKLSKKEKSSQILTDINGYVNPGEMLAIVGPPGCGKSNLLRILAKRKVNGVSGEIIIDNRLLDDYLFKNISIVERKDIFLPEQTVRGLLSFSVHCRINHKILKKEEREEFIELLMDILKIEHVKNSKLGTLSPSKRKRVSICVGLANNPSILYLDQPTIGLSQSKSLKLIKDISNICKILNTTIVATMHQPSSTTLEKFDSLLLLKKGEAAYFGPIGRNCCNVLNYFNQYGFKIKKYMEPLKFILSIISEETNEQYSPQSNDGIIGYKNERKGSRKRVYDFQVIKEKKKLFDAVKEYKESNIYIEELQTLENIAINRKESEIYDKGVYSTTWLQQFRLVFKRAFKNRIRRPTVYFANFIRSLLFGIFFGTLFIRMGYEQPDARAKVSFFFFSFFFGTMVCSGSIPHVILEKKIYVRECLSKFYHPTAYISAFLISSLPFSVSNSVIFIVPSFFLSNYDTGHHSSKFWYCVFIYILTFVLYDFMAITLACLLNSNVSQPACINIILLAILFGGFLVMKPTLENGYIWAHYLDFLLSYSLEAVTTNEFQGLTFHCPNNRGAVPVPLQLLDQY
ncbi:hypothetical protein DICPUDRAFT_148150 [Dictyostelium purpureum]|uniref:ABC transporter domain-containing protein n=1 Tax=Dictyostelium purpureum TaxID=5786 RepID=F0ZAE0_DICPU|nr:uncharacterized protein DICPUDRAFT_148150 [Dictyostelium purpureum]EGC39133.1 hypothetical protein DICPUDRAFT_148150 [Dictyostelium purpureum]|eukprot:XP_003284385.1 hypothetical protein DICPUDRAFT_148150 [Dictyostelium purpureum]